MFTLDELRVLHKAVLDAKFRPGGIPELRGSSLLASAARKIIERLEEGEPGRWNDFVRTEVWLRPEFDAAVETAKLAAIWKTWCREEKVKAAKDLLGPFVPSRQDLDRFLRTVDEHFAPPETNGPDSARNPP